MLNLTRAAIFVSLMLMLLFKKIPLKGEESTSPDLPSALLFSSTHVNNQAVFWFSLHRVHRKFWKTSENDTEMSLSPSLSQFLGKLLVFLWACCDGVLIRDRQTGWNNSRGRLDYKSCEQLTCLHGGLACLIERGTLSAYGNFFRINLRSF